MRRFLFGVVIASVTTAMPGWAIGGDREIAKAVMAELQQHKAQGKLKGFDLDMRVEDGVVYLDGRVASREQRSLVAEAAAKAVGVGNLVSSIEVVPTESKKPRVTRKAPPEKVTTKKVPPARDAKPQDASVQTADAKALSATESKDSQPVKVANTKAVQTASGRLPTGSAVSDEKVTDVVITQLQQLKSSGQLKGFELDVSTVNGDLWLKGQVASPAQKTLVLDAARRVRGVKRVIDDMQIVPAEVQTASTSAFAPAAAQQPTPIPQTGMPAGGMPLGMPQGSSMPTGQVQTMPQAFGPAMATSAPMAGAVAGTPVPMQGGVAYGAGAPRYDQPNLPSYAWPSYAAYPNYSAVTYPRQYSPSAWPYIGPFYPYPQVPLGWREVSLEWDDGLWYLDFTSKAH